jgi:hypothetical protein
MNDLVRFFAGVAADLLRGRSALVAENALLRQQLIVARRKLAGRVRWAPWHDGPGGADAPTWRSVTRSAGDDPAVAPRRFPPLLAATVAT